MVVGDIFQRLSTKACLCALMAVAADWLFYGQPLGWTIGLYAGLVMGLVLLTHKNLLRSSSAKIVAAATFLLIVQMVNAPGILVTAMYVLSLVTLIILKKRQAITDAMLWVQDIARFIFSSFRQMSADQRCLLRMHHKRGFRGGKVLRYAVLPLLMTVIFSCLFIKANPIIANIVDQINFDFAPTLLRCLFWTASLIVIWRILRPNFMLASKGVGSSIKHINFDRWFSKNSVIMSLVVFNTLFAIENILDIAFLWNGEALPDGVSYAAYAHDGAYPLIITTLIAAVYVLITFGKDDESHKSSVARVGVYLWIAQNIFLVFSSIERTMHYIEWYSLTYLRLAALIWMGLIALGVFLIVLRIAMNKDNLWLINVNTVSVIGILYICCFINFDRMIADYNVHHSKEASGGGDFLDFEYIKSLGPEALPGLKWLQEQPNVPVTALQDASFHLNEDLKSRVNGNWRAWTWRNQRLTNELNMH